jgi:hypothetical protein
MLTENCRFANIDDSPLAKFAVGARIGQPDLSLLDAFNAKCLAGDGPQALAEAIRRHPNGADMIVLAPTIAMVESINSEV